MKLWISLALTVILVGCTVRGGWPRFLHSGEASDGAIKRELAARTSAVGYLKEQLDRRSIEIIDLEGVGKTMVVKWGKPAAEYAVFNQWPREALGKECDVAWLQNQPPRLRDLAWLICFKSQWLPVK